MLLVSIRIMVISREQIAKGLMEGAVYSVVVRPENYDAFEGIFNGVLRQENGGVAENHLHHKGTRTTGTMVFWTGVDGAEYLEEFYRRVAEAYEEKTRSPLKPERSIKSKIEVSASAS